VIPEKVAAEDDCGPFLLHDDDGIAAGMPGKILDVENDGAQSQLGFRIIELRRSNEIFDLGFLFRSDVLAEKFQIFSVDPGRDVTVSDNDCAFLGEHGISGDMIEMVVGVDDELDGELGDHADFAEEGVGSGLVFKRIDYGDAVIAHDKSRVRAGFAFGVVNGGVDAVAKRLEYEGQGGVGLGRQGILGTN